MSDDDFDIPNPTEGFPHRWPIPLRDMVVAREQMHRLLDKLLDFEADTHPFSGAVDEKELNSISALVHAGKLVELLAGWAIDHRAGLALNDVAGFPWPQGDETAKQSANDHRHEMEGGTYLEDIRDYDGLTGDPDTNRKILAAVISRGAVTPSSLRRQLAEALKALDEGETRDLFERAKRKSLMGRTLWQARLRAISHVYFLKETGMTKTVAVTLVAEAYGVGSDTVDAWDKRGLKEHFEAARVTPVKERASRLGKAVYRRQNTIPQDEEDRDFIRIHLELYGREGLAQSGQSYKLQ